MAQTAELRGSKKYGHSGDGFECPLCADTPVPGWRTGEWVADDLPGFFCARSLAPVEKPLWENRGKRMCTHKQEQAFFMKSQRDVPFQVID
jgi:hypothetical protein